MSQSRTGSAVETGANIVIGFSINYGANLALLPIMWDETRPALSAFRLGLAFTVISIVRSFVLRRVFNRIKAKWNTGREEANREVDRVIS